MTLLIFSLTAYCSSSNEIDENSAKPKTNLKIEQTRLDKVEQQLSQENLTDSKKLTLLLEKLDLQIKMKNYQQAKMTLQSAENIADSQTSAPFHYQKGIYLYKIQNYSEAITSLKYARQYNKSYQANLRERFIARSYYKMANYGPGIRVLAMAAKRIKGFEKDLEYYQMIAFGFQQINLCKRSIKILNEEALKKFPSEPSLLKIKQECLAEK